MPDEFYISSEAGTETGSTILTPHNIPTEWEDAALCYSYGEPEYHEGSYPPGTVSPDGEFEWDDDAGQYTATEITGLNQGDVISVYAILDMGESDIEILSVTVVHPTIAE